MEILLTENYKIVCNDGMNWQMHEYAENKSGKRKGQKDWHPLQCYLRSVFSACTWILDNAIRRTSKADEMTLREYMAALYEIEADILKHVKEYEKR